MMEQLISALGNYSGILTLLLMVLCVVLLVITLSLELTESYQPLLRRIVDQLRFDGQ